MKKMRILLLAGVVGAFMSSCTIAHSVTVTNNPVGTKTGVAKSTNLGNIDVTLEKAAKDAGITKIGTVEFKATAILFFVKYKTTVTGE